MLERMQYYKLVLNLLIKKLFNMGKRQNTYESNQHKKNDIIVKISFYFENEYILMMNILEEI